SLSTLRRPSLVPGGSTEGSKRNWMTSGFRAVAGGATTVTRGARSINAPLGGLPKLASARLIVPPDGVVTSVVTGCSGVGPSTAGSLVTDSPAPTVPAANVGGPP